MPTNKNNRSAVASHHLAVVGAGMAGVACARTLVQAGHRFDSAFLSGLELALALA